MELCSGNVPDETDEEDGSATTPGRQFWLRLVEVGLLAVPGWHFLSNTYAEGDDAPTSPASTSTAGRIGHFA